MEDVYSSAIVIPVYKKYISVNEKASLVQCINVLGAYPIVFVAPHHLNMEVYKQICRQYNIIFRVERFDEYFFTGLMAYSTLMLDISFYQRFTRFYYILIYQLDAWVFDDQLSSWIKRGYDYIGAPWFVGFSNADENSPMLPIAGNGGFSLRCVESMRSILEYINNLYITKIFERSTNCSALFSVCKLFYKITGQKNILIFLSGKKNQYEDYVISSLFPQINTQFRVAPPEDARYFSFEVNPSALYLLTEKQLPFGCHGWEKYEPTFWSKFITIDEHTL